MTHLLAALACLGHLVLMVGSHNFFYGLRGPKWVGTPIHLGHALAVIALPVGLVAGWGFSLSGLLAWPPSCWVHATVLASLALCLAALFVLLPAVTLARALRVQPMRVTRREAVDLAR